MNSSEKNIGQYFFNITCIIIIVILALIVFKQKKDNDLLLKNNEDYRKRIVDLEKHKENSAPWYSLSLEEREKLKQGIEKQNAVNQKQIEEERLRGKIFKAAKSSGAKVIYASGNNRLKGDIEPGNYEIEVLSGYGEISSSVYKSDYKSNSNYNGIHVKKGEKLNKYISADGALTLHAIYDENNKLELIVRLVKEKE